MTQLGGLENEGLTGQSKTYDQRVSLPVISAEVTWCIANLAEAVKNYNQLKSKFDQLAGDRANQAAVRELGDQVTKILDVLQSSTHLIRTYLTSQSEKLAEQYSFLLKDGEDCEDSYIDLEEKIGEWLE